VYGIVGTTTIGALSQSCAMGNPCEVSRSRPTGAQTCNETNYGTQATQFNGCFGEDGFDSLLSTCPLKQKIGTDRLIPTRIVNTPANHDRWNPDLLWQVEVPTDWAAVKYKQGPAHTVNCEDEAGYSEAISVADGQPLQNVSMVDQEGLHRFCVVGKRAATSFQPFDQSTYFVTYIDKTSPTRIPTVQPGFGPLSVEPLFEVPELTDFKYFLPEGETDSCPSDTSSYRRYMRFPFPVDLNNKRQAPLCLQGADYADHWSPIYRFLAVNSSAPADTGNARAWSVMV